MGNAPDIRHTPAGIAIARFTLKHSSEQSEGGLKRQAVCNITVIASGDELQRTVQQLKTGEGVRVSGFLARANNRQGENRLVLHADQIDRL